VNWLPNLASPLDFTREAICNVTVGDTGIELLVLRQKAQAAADATG